MRLKGVRGALAGQKERILTDHGWGWEAGPRDDDACTIDFVFSPELNQILKDISSSTS